MTEHERWLPIVGLEGFFEVSDQGRVRSLDRDYITHSHRHGRPFAARRRLKGRIFKLSRRTRDGYVYVGLSANGVIHHRKVHQLVLEAFVGPRPPGMESCHNNHVRHDNRLVNLRWDTRKANARDRAINGSQIRTHCRRGHEFTVENTAILPKQGTKRCRTCTREYGKHYQREYRKILKARRAETLAVAS